MEDFARPEQQARSIHLQKVKPKLFGFAIGRCQLVIGTRPDVMWMVLNVTIGIHALNPDIAIRGLRRRFEIS
jgi:hypothetical protein